MEDVGKNSLKNHFFVCFSKKIYLCIKKKHLALNFDRRTLEITAVVCYNKNVLHSVTGGLHDSPDRRL